MLPMLPFILPCPLPVEDYRDCAGADADPVMDFGDLLGPWLTSVIGLKSGHGRGNSDPYEICIRLLLLVAWCFMHDTSGNHRQSVY